MMANDPNNTAPDPALDALLDEALSVESVEGGIPAGLSDRVFAATCVELRARHEPPAVLARIGGVRTFAVAASVLLLVGGALWLSVSERVNPVPRHGLASRGATPSLDTIPAPEVRSETALTYDNIDRELDLLAVQVEQYADNTRWDAGDSLGDAWDELDFQTDAAVF